MWFPDPDRRFFDTIPSGVASMTVVIDGQHMVLIPALYIKRTRLTAGEYAGKHAWLISDKPLGRVFPSIRPSS
jgi:hypothetical protein